MRIDSIEPSSWTATFAGTLASANAIKQSVATNTGTQSYNAAAMDGSIGATTMSVPRTLSITLSASAASYNNTDPIIITGVNSNGEVITESFTPTTVNGGETLRGTKDFVSVLQINTPAQADGLGAFQFGVEDVVCNPRARQIRIGTAGSGNLKLQYNNGNADTITKLTAGERLDVFAAKIIANGTDVQDITVLF